MQELNKTLRTLGEIGGSGKNCEEWSTYFNYLMPYPDRNITSSKVFKERGNKLLELFINRGGEKIVQNALKKPFKKRQIYILKKLKRRHKSSKTALCFRTSRGEFRNLENWTKQETLISIAHSFSSQHCNQNDSNSQNDDNSPSNRGGGGERGGFSVAEKPECFCVRDNCHHLDH